MADPRHPEALRLMPHAEQEIARIVQEAGVGAAEQATVMTAVRMLSRLCLAAGFEAAMRALNTVHDAAEGDIMRLSLSERCKSQVDSELERIGIKVAAHFAEKPRHAPGKTAP